MSSPDLNNRLIARKYIHLKAVFDGCESLDEIISKIETIKTYMENKKLEGFKLAEKVFDGYAILNRVKKAYPDGWHAFDRYLVETSLSRYSSAHRKSEVLRFYDENPKACFALHCPDRNPTIL